MVKYALVVARNFKMCYKCSTSRTLGDHSFMTCDGSRMKMKLQKKIESVCVRTLKRHHPPVLALRLTHQRINIQGTWRRKVILKFLVERYHYQSVIKGRP